MRGKLDDLKLNPVISEQGPGFGNPAEGVICQAADCLIVFVGRQPQSQTLVQFLDRQCGIDLVPGAAQGHDAVARGGDVVLVVDLTDEFFEQVFQGDQSGDAAILVEDDSDL